MKWTDSEDIGIALAEKFPDVDPLTLRFTDLRERVMTLEHFDDDPKTSNEPKLEAIQMAWSFSLWRQPKFNVSVSRVKLVRDVPCNSAMMADFFETSMPPTIP